MTETRAQLRLATTAIAAALAISATPLLAQDAPAPDTSAETPVPAAADPLAPAPTTDSIVPTETTAPETTVAPEATPATTKAKATTRTTKTTTVRRTTSTASPAARPAPAPAQSAVTPAPAVTLAVPAPLPPVAEAAPIEPAPAIVEPAASRQMQMKVMLAIGAALVGLAALVAAALALRRRRRRREELLDNEVYETEAMVAEPEPVMTIEPGPVRKEPTFVAAAAPAFVPAAAPVVALASAPVPAEGGSAEVEGPVTELPEDFDLSRFGHHVQQAYKGPTEDNPSLSLRHRLSRASGMDQMERNMDAEVEAATGESVLEEADATPVAEAPAAKPAVADKAPGDFMLTKPGTKATVRRAYSE